MSAAAERTNPDVDLLVACEAFHAAHRDMKAGRGDTPEAEAAISSRLLGGRSHQTPRTSARIK